MSHTLNVLCISLLQESQEALTMTKKGKLNFPPYPLTLGWCWSALGIRLPYFGVL